jgi:hypothetical protein
VENEELVKRMDETEDNFSYQFNSHEYLRAVKYLKRDRDLWRAEWSRLALASTEVAK